MATSSLKTPIRVLSPQGVKALCDAYDEGVTKDLKFKPSPSDPSLTPDMKKAIDSLFKSMGF